MHIVFYTLLISLIIYIQMFLCFTKHYNHDIHEYVTWQMLYYHTCLRQD
jgi:hypothetical protein